ncbi:MAG TPA: methyltransferase domain-containing protein [Chloroflexota bacterium]|nr:methyltransferase domain-containing protein [Chloroflexota bacterium]
MQARAQDHHDWKSADYAERWVADATARDPEREAQLALLAQLIPQPRDAAIRVLDMGAGYGIVSAAVLNVFPAAQITLMDYSAAMLDHARARLAAHAGQLRWALGDLSAPGWERELQGPFDAVVSAAVLHNLRDGARVRALYGEIAKVLAPGGAFLNLDHVNPGGPRIEEQYAVIRGTGRQGAMRRLARPQAMDEAEAAAPAVPRWQRYPADLPTNLAWLREAGFAEVDCFSKEFQRTLFGGYMP